MPHLIQSEPIICALYLHCNVEMSHLIQSEPIICALYLHCNVEMPHLIQSDPIICTLIYIVILKCSTLFSLIPLSVLLFTL